MSSLLTCHQPVNGGIHALLNTVAMLAPTEVPMPEPQPADIARAAALQQRLVQETHGCLLAELEVRPVR